MSVVIETTLGDITVDLFLEQRPITCLNFLKLCKMKYYNFNLFHSIRSGFIAQTGDPSGEGSGGESIWGLLNGPEKRFFSGEKMPKIRHTDAGLLSMVCTGDMMVGSQFFFTLGPDLDSLDGVHCVIGEVTEGHEILRKLNDVICDETHRPYQDVRITHTVILEDPFSDPPGLRAPSRSPSPSAERLKGGRIAPDEELDEAQGKSAAEIQEMIEEKEAKARATILEIVGDLPDADIAPPENVLFVCKLNPVTTDEDLEIIFSRFGKIVNCEVIRDKKTGDSLQYAFIEFDDKKSCEDAYFKMDNVLIDDRRIHVDFSQSVSKMRWLGKGRGVQHFNDDGQKISERQQNKSRDSHNERQGYRQDKHNDSRRTEDKYNRNDVKVTNKRGHRERSRSRSRADHHNSRDRQNSRKTDEGTKRDNKRERSPSKSKSFKHKTDKSSTKEEDKSRHRNEDKSLNRSHNSESKRQDKYRSSRHHESETRIDKRESNRDEVKRSRKEHQHRSNLMMKNVGDSDTNEDEYVSRKKTEDRSHNETERKRSRREDSDDEFKRSEKSRKISEHQSESDGDVIERAHKGNSHNHSKDMQKIKNEEKRRHENKHRDNSEKEKSNNDNDRSNDMQDERNSRDKYTNKEKYTSKDRSDSYARYDNNDRIVTKNVQEQRTSYKEKLSRDANSEFSRHEEKYDRQIRSEKLRTRDGDRYGDQQSTQQDEDEKRTEKSRKRQDHHNKNNDSDQQIRNRQERRDHEELNRHRSDDNEASKVKHKQSTTIEPKNKEKSKLSRDSKKKNENKKKNLKKKLSEKKKSSNKKETKKRKRRSSTSSDSDSDSSDSSSSSETSSSSSDSDRKKKSKRRRKHSSSSSSSDSSTSSSSDSSSDTSSSSSDSDVKKKKVKKNRKRTDTKSKK